MGSPRKVRLKNQKERREQPHFTPNDIVLAIKGVEAAGLKVYGAGHDQRRQPADSRNPAECRPGILLFDGTSRNPARWKP
jgi:hypothetical protein